MSSQSQCRGDDFTLKEWTFLRYVVLSVMMLWRVVKIKENGKTYQEALETSRPYRLHLSLTMQMNESDQVGNVMGFVVGMFYAGCIFVQTEGVGLVIYFGLSALMDNLHIFLVPHIEFCQYVTAVALYSMALVTFIPNCLVAYYLQSVWYDQGRWRGTKTVFVLVMVMATVVSFLARLYLVYDLRWAYLVSHLLQATDYKVLIAILTPPLVDGVQSFLLLSASLKANEDHSRGVSLELVERDFLSGVFTGIPEDEGGTKRAQSAPLPTLLQNRGSYPSSVQKKFAERHSVSNAA